MKTSIVNEAVKGQNVALALKSGAYTVAGTGLCGLGSVLDTAADVGQKVVDMTRAAGEACTAKGEEFLAEAAAIKGEQPAKKEEKVEAPQQQAAQANKTWSLADFVAQHNEFANAATAVIKEYTKVVFRAEGSVKGVVTAFDAIRRSDGVNCSIFADMEKKTFSVVTPPAKAEKPEKKAAKKAAAPAKKAVPKQEKAAASAKKTVKAETKTEEAKEESSMKAALEAARAKKAAKTKTAKTEPAKTEKSSKKAVPVKEAAKKETKIEAKKEEKSSKKAEGKKEAYSSNPKADMALEEAVHDHGEWLDKIIRYFQSISVKALSNVVVRSNYLKFSSYGENGQEDAVSVAFKSHKVKVNRKEVKLDL